MTSAPPPYPRTSGFEPCATTDPELFFPERNNDFIQTTKEAKILCRSCPVRLPCLEYALGTDVEGIWGATDERERRIMQRGGGIEPYKLMKALAPYLPN